MGMKLLTKRQSNFELLRIVAMVMIVAHHFAIHGDFVFAGTEASVNQVWLSFLTLGGKLGVNLFVLISGYFLCTRTENDWLKSEKLHVQILMYSLGIFLFSLLMGETFTPMGAIKATLPIAFGNWWFATMYFFLFVFSPYISHVLERLSPKQYSILLLLMFVSFSVLPAILHQSVKRNELIWFVFMYALGAYFRKYDSGKAVSAWVWMLISGILAVFMVTWVTATDIRHVIPFITAEQKTIMHSCFSIPMVLLSCTLFLAFKNMKIPYSGVINWVAAATFGVYLFHDSPYIRYLLWRDLFRNKLFTTSVWLIPYSLFAIVAVFAACTLIERLRMLVFGKWFDRLQEKLFAVVQTIAKATQKRFVKKDTM